MDALSEAGRPDGWFETVNFAQPNVSRARGYWPRRGVRATFHCSTTTHSSSAPSARGAIAVRTQTSLTWQVVVWSVHRRFVCLSFVPRFLEVMASRSPWAPWLALSTIAASSGLVQLRRNARPSSSKTLFSSGKSCSWKTFAGYLSLRAVYFRDLLI